MRINFGSASKDNIRKEIIAARPSRAANNVNRERLKVYEKETKPVLNFYGKSLVHRINTDAPPVETFFDILKQVVKL